MKKEVINQIGELMTERVAILLRDHTDAVITRLEEEIAENEGERTQFSVPISVMIVFENGEYKIEPSFDLVKRTKRTFKVDPIVFNPNQGDLFDGDQSASSEPAPGAHEQDSELTDEPPPLLLNKLLPCENCDEETQHYIESGDVYCVKCNTHWGSEEEFNAASAGSEAV
jgi:hypothetical protein